MDRPEDGEIVVIELSCYLNSPVDDGPEPCVPKTFTGGILVGLRQRCSVPLPACRSTMAW